METKRMYELAFQFKKARLWRTLLDDEIFAVRLSDGEIGYCSVMGMLGEHLALGLYIGAEGFQTYRDLSDAEIDRAPVVALRQSCLMCSFENSDMLSEEELSEARNNALALHVKLRGKNAFPQFLKYAPAKLPVPIDDDADRRRICEALEAGIALAEMLRSYSKEDIRLSRYCDAPDRIPLLAPENGRIALKYTEMPPEAPHVWPSPALANDVTVARLRSLPKRGCLECGLVLMPVPVQEDETETPYFPTVLICVDPDRDEMLELPPMQDPDAEGEAFLNSFSEELLERKACPAKLVAAGVESEAFFSRFCQQVGIPLEVDENMPTLRDAIQDMLEDLDDEDWDDEDWDDEDWDDGEFGLPEDTPLFQEIEKLFQKLVEEVEDAEEAERPHQLLQFPGTEAALPQPKVSGGRSAGASQQKGDCYLCGAAFRKGGYRKHFTARHQYAGSDGQDCYLLRVEDAWNPDYWLFLDLPLSSTLKTLDEFLRAIWLECCGHMSSFSAAWNMEIPKSRKLSAFEPGSTLRYEYDFGSTTELQITFCEHIRRPKQKKAVRLVARNQPPEFICGRCGKTAAWISADGMFGNENPFFCKDCAEDQDMLLPVTNSPRMGVCAYSGEQDTYAFDPDKVPQK